MKKALVLISIASLALLVGCRKEATAANDDASTQDSTFTAESTSEDSSDASTSTDGADDSATQDQGLTKEFVYGEYAKLISSLPREQDEYEWTAFQLIDLDDNGISELILSDAGETNPGLTYYEVVGCNESGIVDNEVLQAGVGSGGGFRGELYYLPGTGKLSLPSLSAYDGSPSDLIYELKDGKLEQAATGYIEIGEGDSQEECEENGTHYWNDEEVTADEYKTKFKEATENTKPEDFENIEFVDKDAILGMLK